jgi:hypothetical protein
MFSPLQMIKRGDKPNGPRRDEDKPRLETDATLIKYCIGRRDNELIVGKEMVSVKIGIVACN